MLESQTLSLQMAYLGYLRELSVHINAAYETLLRNGWDEEAAQQLGDWAHRLAEVSQQVNNSQVAEAAIAIERLLQGLSSHPPERGSQQPALFALLKKKLSSLGRALPLSLAEAPASAIPSQAAVRLAQKMRCEQVIYLYSNHGQPEKELVQQAGYFGYVLQVFTELEGFAAALQACLPEAVLIDVETPGDCPPLPSGPGKRPKLVFISSQDDVAARLQAIRLGGEAFFTRPVNISRLIDVLDGLTEGVETLPYRVMIIDDMPIQARVTAMALEKAGMRTRLVGECWNLMDDLGEFNPDLILMDLNMPDCTGIELAKVIRQAEQYKNIPVIYLSGELERDRKAHPIGMLGTVLLSKPIKPVELVSVVSAHIERYRQLNGLIMRDGLTGLINHSIIKERLAQEMALAERQKTTLAFAMLDIDNFKTINDTYGHAAGDRVIKSLANLLGKRLRKVDTIGRYGGDELCVIFPGATEMQAATRLDELRQDFSLVLHRSGAFEFSATFSCGIAAYPQFLTPLALNQAADHALYRAKHQGRNRVILAKKSGS